MRVFEVGYTLVQNGKVRSSAFAVYGSLENAKKKAEDFSTHCKVKGLFILIDYITEDTSKETQEILRQWEEENANK